MKRLYLGLLLIISIMLTSCGISSDRALINSINDRFDLKIEGNYEIEELFDTHGGFHNDGRGVKKIKFSDDGLEGKLKDNKKFLPTPFTSDIEIILYGDEDFGGIFNYDDKGYVPTITDGYYSFYDKFHNELNNQVSYDHLPYNFILVVYDNANKVLYICEFDS